MTDEELIARLREGCSCNINSTPCLAETECRDCFAAADRIKAQAAEIERLLGDVEKRRETRMSDDDLIRRGDALYAIAGWEIPSTAISALPAVTQPAPDTAADRIKAQAAEIERLRAKLAKAEAMLEREIMRVKKIQSDLPPPHKVPLSAVQSEYELMLAELKGVMT